MSEKKHEGVRGLTEATDFAEPVASPQATRPTCPSCGYTKEDADFHLDHHLCNLSGKAPWEGAAQPAAGTTVDQQFAGMATDEKYKAESAKICSEFDRLSAGTTPQAERLTMHNTFKCKCGRDIVVLGEIVDIGVPNEPTRAVAPVETPPDTSSKALEACRVGSELADLGHSAGRWDNRFVAAIASELLAAREKLAEFGIEWDGEKYAFNAKD